MLGLLSVIYTIQQFASGGGRFPKQNWWGKVGLIWGSVNIAFFIVIVIAGVVEAMLRY